LKDAFWILDTAQRACGAQVRVYAACLPERAERSGLLPRHSVLDAQAEGGAVEYLDVIDRFPLESGGLSGAKLASALQAFRQLEPRLRSLTTELDEFVTIYSAEFALVGEQTRRIEEQKSLAERAAREAHDLWGKLRNEGFDSTEADTALAKARVAHRGVKAWQPAWGLPKLVETVLLVEGYAAQLRSLLLEYPAQVARARRRLPSLRTRLDAIATRSGAIDRNLGALRREFSVGNWQDLDGQDDLVAGEMARARALLDQLQGAIVQERWDDAIRVVAEVEDALQDVDEAVDTPRERLAVLREFRENPAARLEQATFAIKDAQVMVVKGSVHRADDIATRLDALALQLDGVRPLLEGLHPNFWSILRFVDDIQREVREEVARYRERAR
jgi:hypothetical protein